MTTSHTATSGEPIWVPDTSVTAGSRIARFTDFVARRTGVAHTDYQSSGRGRSRTCLVSGRPSASSSTSG